MRRTLPEANVPRETCKPRTNSTRIAHPGGNPVHGEQQCPL